MCQIRFEQIFSAHSPLKEKRTPQHSSSPTGQSKQTSRNWNSRFYVTKTDAAELDAFSCHGLNRHNVLTVFLWFVAGSVMCWETIMCESPDRPSHGRRYLNPVVYWNSTGLEGGDGHQPGNEADQCVCGCLCVCLYLLHTANQNLTIKVKTFHWSSQLQKIVWGSSPVFKVELRAGFRSGLGSGLR